MNIVVGSAALFVAAAVVYIAIKPQPADEYPVSMASAYNRLASTTLDLSHGRKGPFGGLSTSVSGNGHNQIEWKAGGTFAAFDCTLNLAPLGDTRTRVTHTYDWSRLTDPHRLARAHGMTADNLQASLDRLADVAEQH